MGREWHLWRRMSCLYLRGTIRKVMFLWGNHMKKIRHWIIRQLDQIHFVNSKSRIELRIPDKSTLSGPFSVLELTKQLSDLLLFQSQYRVRKQSSTSSIEPGNNKNSYEMIDKLFVTLSNYIFFDI